MNNKDWLNIKINKDWLDIILVIATVVAAFATVGIWLEIPKTTETVEKGFEKLTENFTSVLNVSRSTEPLYISYAIGSYAPYTPEDYIKLICQNLTEGEKTNYPSELISWQGTPGYTMEITIEKIDNEICKIHTTIK